MSDISRPSHLPHVPYPHVIYPTSLNLLGQGYALWFPEPHATVGEPQIGDVGYVSEGSFIRLFNINTGKPEHKVTTWDPPFESNPAPPANAFLIDMRHGSLGPGRYVSHGVQERETRGSVSM